MSSFCRKVRLRTDVVIEIHTMVNPPEDGTDEASIVSKARRCSSNCALLSVLSTETRIVLEIAVRKQIECYIGTDDNFDPPPFETFN